MANKIPIDDLFRDVLSEGKEQLNLGAWANMERMLNGQNPYKDDGEEPGRKRRILPFLAIFLLLSSAISAGYWWISKKDKQQHKPMVTVVEDHKAVPKTQTTPTLSDPLNTHGASENPAATASANEQALHTSKSEKQAARKALREQRRQERRNVGVQAGDSQHTNMNQATDKDAPISKTTTPPAQPALNTASETGKNEKLVVNEDNKELNKKPGKNKNRTIDQITTRETRKRNRNLSNTDIQFDTIGINKNEIGQNYVEVPEPKKGFVDMGPDYKYHPRYLGADIQAVEQPVVMNTSGPSIVSTPALSSHTDAKKSRKETSKPGVFEGVGDFAGSTIRKAGEAGSNVLRMFGVFDPGISLGVNAALFNTQHNYGGFHAGITNHTAISDLFSVITELKFFIRNNSGFTVNDIQTNILNPNIDTITNAALNQTIYTYQVDSLTKKYNFKNFMSLELPVMLNARFRNLSVYAGPNFVYNFKLNVQEIDRKFVSDRQDVVPNGTAYNYPATTGMQYVRSDFGSRFGIGYAAGVSYNFNPKVSLDLRLSKVVWDNTKTNSARAISNGVSKVPFTQLSIGYRFLDKSKD